MVTTKKDSASKKEVESTSNRKALAGKSPVKAAPKKSGTMRRSTATASRATVNKNGTKKADSKTSVTIKYDVGFPNQLYLRGEGPDLELNWEEGVPLKNVAPDTWVWETRKPFGKATFKILINDEHFEDGEDHSLTQGTSIEYTPTF